MKQKGFTLIELIIVIAIFAIFSLAVYNYQSGEFNLYRKLSAQTTLQGDAKTAVEQITFDIKKSRLTQYSVETDFTDTKFQTLISNLGTDYKPIVYIDFLNTDAHGNNYNSCLYAFKKSTRQLVKIFLTSNEFTLMDDSTVINITDGYDSTRKSYINQFATNTTNNELKYYQTQLPGLTGSNCFIYEEQGNYYLVYEVGSDYSVVNQYNLQQESSTVARAQTAGTNTPEQVIVNNVDSVNVVSTDIGVANAQNNSFNINISLSNSITINGQVTTLNQSFNSNATRLRYDGGDENAGN